MPPSAAVPEAPLPCFLPANDLFIKAAVPRPELVEVGLRSHPYREAGPHFQLAHLPSVDAAPIDIVAETF